MKLEEQKVLLFTRTMGQGGTENVVLQLCEILKPRVNKIIVCSSGGINVKKLNSMGIKHYLIPDIAGKNPYSMIKTIAILKGIIKKEKITLVHSHHRMAAFYSRLISNKQIIRVSTAHNIFEDKKRITHWGYKRSNIIAVGKDVAQNLMKVYKVPKKNISVISNAISPFSGEIIKLPVFQENSNSILIGNIARLSEQKGLTYFIEAARIVTNSFPNAKFYIIGEGEDEEKLKDLVKKLKLESVVSFLGFRSDIQNVISQLDFVVLSSLWEGFPLTPIESFSVGKTIVATDIEGTREIVLNNFNGLLVPPKDSSSLAEAVLKLINMKDLRSTLEKNSKKTYMDFFSFDYYKEQIIDYYEKLY
ncbi:glycosyltransferase family 4 protein [Lactococcus carnosus]|uniref:glycosyltransferase family 4 protein n=1 Tax=Pseudolactococcus carnosus TaxID=2749961 RepID=UPI001FB8DDAD|nr:glycosyltransferase family 4 protein [Lactococcus carnosus]MCJ1968896.1 glycosyltransferase family 4 protein [Lactococcus carnosus]